MSFETQEQALEFADKAMRALSAIASWPYTARPGSWVRRDRLKAYDACWPVDFARDALAPYVPVVVSLDEISSIMQSDAARDAHALEWLVGEMTKVERQMAAEELPPEVREIIRAESPQHRVLAVWDEAMSARQHRAA